MKLWKVKYKVKQIFCKHKNRVVFDQEIKEHRHKGSITKVKHYTYYCHDCGKIFEVMVED